MLKLIKFYISFQFFNKLNNVDAKTQDFCDRLNIFMDYNNKNNKSDANENHKSQQFGWARIAWINQTILDLWKKSQMMQFST